MFKKVSILIVLIILFLPQIASAKINVVASLPDFASIAKEIGGNRVETDYLVKGTQDPHFVDAKPSLILKVNKADLLVFIGMGLEDGWLPVLLTKSRNPRIQPGKPGYLDASIFITAKDVVANPDRSMGDIHGSGNPHYYTGPKELFNVARGIYQRLVELDPEGEKYFATNWQQFEAKFLKKEKEWLSKISPIKNSKVVVYHESWVYLLDWLGFEKVDSLEPIPGIEPSPSHVIKLLNKVKDQNVSFLIQEVYHPTNLSKIFATKSGAKMLILPAMVTFTKGNQSIWEKFDLIINKFSE